MTKFVKILMLPIAALIFLTVACQKDMSTPQPSTAKPSRTDVITLKGCYEGVRFDGSKLVFADHKAYINTYACLQNQIQEAVKTQAEEFRNEGIEEDQFNQVAAERGIDPIANVLDAFEQHFDGYMSFRTSVRENVKRWLTEEDAAEERDPNRHFIGDEVARTLANAEYISQVEDQDISFKAEDNTGGVQIRMNCVSSQSKSQWFYPSSSKKIKGWQWIQDLGVGGLVMGTTEAYSKINLWIFGSYWVPAIFSSTQTCKSGFVYKPGCSNGIGVTSSCLSFPFVSAVIEFFIPQEGGIRALPGRGHYKTTHSAFGFTGTITN
jgi:hypothetical protein